ncbi:RlmE family RNA methyltransferase [Candidatus Bathyarchaeota archaeon]|nr:RlmE family RNA methyltransferase [Candidatus Bathyarchaeota archaeon]
MSRRWRTERKSDHYHKMAKEEGYRSRAAYKLKQLDDRFHLFKGARYVLDIGAAPGGWLQVASEAVGEDGLVVGVDQNPIENLELDNVETIVGDILDEETLDEIRELLPGSVDVVLSDLSPNISGAWEVDQFLQIDLARMALKVSQDLLRRDGWFVVKVFMGPEYEAYLKDVKSAYRKVNVVKPLASRKGSAEVYLVARHLGRGRRPR